MKIYTTTNVTAHPPSFDWKLKIVFLAHFYTRNAKMELGSDKEPHPLKGHIYRPKQKAE
jgi:hypothetical protein